MRYLIFYRLLQSSVILKFFKMRLSQGFTNRLKNMTYTIDAMWDTPHFQAMAVLFFQKKYS